MAEGERTRPISALCDRVRPEEDGLTHMIVMLKVLPWSFLVRMGTEDRVVASETPEEWMSLLLLLLHCYQRQTQSNVAYSANKRAQFSISDPELTLKSLHLLISQSLVMQCK